MPGFDKKDFLVKTLSGKVFNIFYKDKLGICISFLNRKNLWSEPEILINEAHSNFDLVIDEREVLHMLYQDQNGTLAYCIYENGTIAQSPILKSKTPAIYNKYPRCIRIKGDMYFFYVIAHNDNMLLSYQILNAKTGITTPKVIDYALKDGQPYNIVNINDGNIYVLYKSFDNNFNQIGYKKLALTSGHLSIFFPLTSSNSDNETPIAAYDSHKRLHLCWQSQTQRQHDLVYAKKNTDSDKLGKQIILHSSNYPFANYSMLVSGEKVICYWIRENSIFYCSSNDGGENWSKPERYSFIVNKLIYSTRYISNIKEECEDACILDLPLAFVSGYRLGFLDEYLPRRENITGDTLRTMLMDSLKSLSTSNEELKNLTSLHERKILELQTEVSSLQKELIKRDIKLNLLESEISTIKSTISDKPLPRVIKEITE